MLGNAINLTPNAISSAPHYGLPEVSELIQEKANNPFDVVGELRQSWDNRLDFPPTKLLKRHLRVTSQCLLNSLMNSGVNVP